MNEIPSEEKQRDEKIKALALRIAEAQDREIRAIERGGGGDYQVLDDTGKVIKRPRKTIFQVARERGLLLDDDIPDFLNVK